MTLPEAAELVAASWKVAVAGGAMSAQTYEKFTALVQRFVQFAAAHGVDELAEVDAGLVGELVRAKGRDRRGEVVVPAVATMRLRRSVLRCWFRTARQLLLTDTDPAADVVLPGRPRRRVRPLEWEEADTVRYFAQLTQAATRHAATTALALAGAHTGEIARITTHHLDLEQGRVWAPGSPRTVARWCVLDRWATGVLERRLQRVPSGAVLVGSGGGSAAQQQARVCTTLRDVLVRAGLGDDPGLRPASLPAHAGWQAFVRTRRVETAAAVLGMRSLDRAAELVGYDWQAALPSPT